MRKKKAKTVHGDAHATAIYSVEAAFLDFNRETLSLAETRRWVARACWAFKLKPPPVRQRPNSMGCTYSLADGSLILFKRRHKNPAVALHEAAHYITDRLFPRTREIHGPTWLGIYCVLLKLTNVCPAPAMAAMLRKVKLRARPVCMSLLRRSLTDTSTMRLDK